MAASFYESPEERSSGLFFCLWVTGAWANRACWDNKADSTNRLIRKRLIILSCLGSDK